MSSLNQQQQQQQESVWISLKSLLSFGLLDNNSTSQSIKVRRHAASIIKTLIHSATTTTTTTSSSSSSVVPLSTKIVKVKGIVNEATTTTTNLSTILVEQKWLLPTLINCIQNEIDSICIHRHLQTLHCIVITCRNSSNSNKHSTSSIFNVRPILILSNSILQQQQQKRTNPKQQQRQRQHYYDIDSKIIACEIMALILSSLTKQDNKSLGSLWPIIETTLIQTISTENDTYYDDRDSYNDDSLSSIS
jgi:hypothetical protein